MKSADRHHWVGSRTDWGSGALSPVAADLAASGDRTPPLCIPLGAAVARGSGW